ncbi:MAG: VanW family protein, partial [Clostridium sp.]|nr:VanW family protein [Clostridium sp.]
SRSSAGRSAEKRSTAARSSASARGSSVGRSAVRRRKRRKGPDLTRILMGIIGALVLIICISLAVKSCRKKTEDPTESETSVESVENLGEKVTVDGIDITGLTEEKAKKAILDSYNWSMKVTYQDKEAAVANLMETRVSELLDEIYTGEKKEASYEVNTDNMTEEAMAEAALIAGEWNMVAKNGGISGYDKSSGTFTFTEGTNGKVIDQEGLASAIVEAIQEKDYARVITASVKEVSPELTAAQLKEKYKTIGTYTTKTTSNSNRNENIRLACAAINGVIVNPGQEFSFNDTTGARTEDKGYKPATAYLNGEVVQEPGGGVCQVSSTLYNAIIFAGLKSTERHAHSYEPSYVTPGEDAAVSFGGPDFKFVNNSDYPIAIKTSFANQELSISIYGVQVLEDGTKIRMVSEKTSELDPPAPTYEEDQTLQPEEQKVVKEAVPGSRWTTMLVTYKDGAEVGREMFHTSTYRGKSAIIKRNTSGVVVTSAPESQDNTADESGESGAAGENTETTEGAESTVGGEGGPGSAAGTEETAGESRAEGTNPPGAAETPGAQAPISPAPGGEAAPGGSSEVTPGNPVISGGPGSTAN